MIPSRTAYDAVAAADIAQYAAVAVADAYDAAGTASTTLDAARAAYDAARAAYHAAVDAARTDDDDQIDVRDYPAVVNARTVMRITRVVADRLSSLTDL